LRVDWIIPCRYFEGNNGLGTIVGAGIDTLAVPELPNDISFLMAVRLIGIPDNAQHTVTMAVDTPGMAPAITPMTSPPFLFQRPPALAEGWEAAILMPMMCQFRAAEEGPYMVTVTVDQTSSKSIPMRIAIGQPPAPGTPT